MGYRFAGEIAAHHYDLRYVVIFNAIIEHPL